MVSCWNILFDPRVVLYLGKGNAVDGVHPENVMDQVFQGRREGGWHTKVSLSNAFEQFLVDFLIKREESTNKSEEDDPN